jgi:hypothetical protein
VDGSREPCHFAFSYGGWKVQIRPFSHSLIVELSLTAIFFQANGDDEDSEYSDDGIEETALESYQTPLDEEECEIDEYQIFQTILQSKYTHWIYEADVICIKGLSV